MTLIQLAHNAGLDPKKSSGSHGGEYKSACPICGGKDRFYIQPEVQMKNCSGRYRCRQCDTHGDTIEFAKKFNGMTFKEAIEYIGAKIPERSLVRQVRRSYTFTPSAIKRPDNIWNRKAEAFVEWSYKHLQSNPEIRLYLNDRGISNRVIDQYKIGWNPVDVWRERESWGLDNPDNKKLWLPKGIVIPTYEKHDGKLRVTRVKIRRDETSSFAQAGKYIAIPGSATGLSIIGDIGSQIMIVVESELDGYALYSLVGDYALIVASGSNTKNPDSISHFIANEKDVLVCHDNDKAGEVMLDKWKKIFPHAIGYTVPFGKDVGEACQNGMDIRSWVLKYKWRDSFHESNMYNALKHMNKQTDTRRAYLPMENDIFDGPNSSRAAETINGIRLMNELLLM